MGANPTYPIFRRLWESGHSGSEIELRDCLAKAPGSDLDWLRSCICAGEEPMIIGAGYLRVPVGMTPFAIQGFADTQIIQPTMDMEVLASGEEGPTPERESRLREPEGNIGSAKRIKLLERHTFRALFYSHGLSPVEVQDLLDLSTRDLGTLMWIHGVGGFGYSAVGKQRELSLKADLTTAEWREVSE